MYRVIRALLVTLVGLLPPDPGAAMGEAANAPGGEEARDAGVTDGTGAVTIRLPIEVLPGPANFQPTLHVVFSSQGGESPLGLGWSLPLQQISRSTRFGIPSFDDSVDRFEYNGELLVPDPETPGRFHTLRESFQRIRFNPPGEPADSWDVTLPNGTRLRLGVDESSRVRRDGPTGPISRFLVSDLTDVNDNRVKFTYDRSDLGTAYLQKVEYTYRDGIPVGGPESLRVVELVYEPRPDVQYWFKGGVEQVQTQRVREIRVTVGGEVFRRRVLRYSQTGEFATQRSRLIETQLYGTDCPLSIADPE